LCPLVPVEYQDKTVNLYAYVGDNPLGFVDPSGFESVQACINRCIQTYYRRLDQINAWLKFELNRMSYCSLNTEGSVWNWSINLGTTYYRDTNPYNPPDSYLSPFHPPNFVDWMHNPDHFVNFRQGGGIVPNGPYGCVQIAHSKISVVAGEYEKIAVNGRLRCAENCRKGCK
jgi:hypothetical protein